MRRKTGERETFVVQREKDAREKVHREKSTRACSKSGQVRRAQCKEAGRNASRAYVFEYVREHFWR